MNRIIILGADSQHAPCEYCGKVEELRPYGKNDAKICFDCGMKDIDETEKNFRAILDGTDDLPKKEQFN